MPERALGSPPDVRTLEALLHITDAALAYLPEEQLLQELLRRVADVLSIDTVAILLLEGDELHARAARGIEEEVERGVRIPLGRGFAGRVAAERRPVTIPDVDHADILNPILREKGIRSLLGVPLLVEGRVIGVLHVGSLTPREFTADEIALLQRVADRAAASIEHGRIFEGERHAREQLEALLLVTDAALAYLPEEQLLQELLRRVADVLSIDTVAILLLEGDELHARAARGIEEEVERGVRIPLGRGFAGRVAAERRPVTIPDVDHADIYNPILREKGIRSLLGVPLLVEGRVIGVLHVGSLTPREFTADETALMTRVADRAALSIEGARLYEQRRVAEALQRRLLPPERRQGPDLEIAGRYLPASGASLGGDWYDVFPLAEGRIGLAVGDVVGHGVEAAAVMGQLRTALRAYAIEGHSPSTVADRVDSLMSSLGPAVMTTLAYLVLDPEGESLDLVTAGHLPPLVVDPSGTARYLESTGGAPLGASTMRPQRSALHPLPTGAVVLLYTDGLIERRNESIDVGLERLRLTAEGHHDVEALCDAIGAEVVPGAPEDDVAFIAARVPPLGDHLHVRWPATLESLAPSRYLLRRWLRRAGATRQEAYDIVVACQEASANAVEHAYGPGQAQIEVEAELNGRQVTVTVRDEGRWRAARGADRGRGIPLMEMLMDDVEIRSTDSGSEVVLTRQLAEPA